MGASESGELQALFDVARPTSRTDEENALASAEARLFGIPAGLRIDRYELEHLIGQGGAGVVFRAHDPELGRHVAVKLLRAERFWTGSSDDGNARLVREARALAKISHPNVIAIYDVGTYSDDTATRGGAKALGVYIVMELVDGPSLRDWLQSVRPWRDVLHAFIAAARGISAAHERGLVHRDFKPSNVLVGDDGRVRVLDFGLARGLTEAPEPPVGRDCADDRTGDATRTGARLGTPRYMSPEQFAAAPTDARTDQFSFCLSLYEALYRALPYLPTEGEELARAKETGAFERPAAGTNVPRWVWPILRRGLSPAPGDRYRSMSALLEELERGLRRRRIATATVVIAAVAAIGVMAGRVSGQPEDAPGPAAVAPPAAAHRRIALFPFVDRTGDARLDFARDGLPHLLSISLARIDGLEPVAYHQLRQSVADESELDSWRAAAQKHGASATVRGELTRGSERVHLTVFVETADGLPIATIERFGLPQEVPNLARRATGLIAQEILGHEVDYDPGALRQFEFDRVLQLGVAAAERDELLLAQEQLGRALELHPDDPTLRFYLAVVASWQDRPAPEVLGHIEAALSNSPDPRQRAFLEGFRAFKEQRHYAAIDLFNAGLQEYGGDRYLWFGLFEALYHGGRPAEAVAAYRKLTDIAPRFRLGVIHVLQYATLHGDHETMAWAVRRAEVTGWEFVPKWKVQALIAQRRYADAAQTLRELDPRLDFVVPLTAWVHAVLGQTALARATAQEHAASKIAGTMLPLAAIEELSVSASRRQTWATVVRTMEAEPLSRSAARRWALLGAALPHDAPAAMTRTVRNRLAQARDVLSGERVVAAHLLLASDAGEVEALHSAQNVECDATRAVASALLAQHAADPDAAIGKWREAIEHSTAEALLPHYRYRLAALLRERGAADEARELCSQISAPSHVQWSWVALRPRCLAWFPDLELPAAAD